MAKRIVTGKFLITCLVLLLAGCGSGQQGLSGRWDRLNVDPERSYAEHEVLNCEYDGEWNCSYSKDPDELGFEDPDSTSGIFTGKDASEGWVCPEWFEDSICETVTYVAAGVMDISPSDEDSFTIDQELIVTEQKGIQHLYVYWNGWFVCPWYRSFDQALEANPFPIPFNGVDGPVFDCIFAPD